MTDSKDELKTMLQHLINDRHDEAESSINAYITTKTARLAGLTPTEEIADQTND